MINLVLKNFRLQKKTLLFGLFCIVMILGSFKFESVLSGILTGGLGMCMMTYLSVIFADEYDEKSKAYMFINSLPINRADIVKSKYLSAIAYMFFYSIIIIGMFFIVNLIGITINFSSSYFLIILFSISILNFVFSIYYPIYFKFGADTFKKLKVVMFFCMVIGLQRLISYIEKMESDKLKNIILFAQSNLKLLIGFSVIISIIFLLISMSISICFYKNREF